MGSGRIRVERILDRETGYFGEELNDVAAIYQQRLKVSGTKLDTSISLRNKSGQTRRVEKKRRHLDREKLEGENFASK